MPQLRRAHHARAVLGLALLLIAPSARPARAACTGLGTAAAFAAGSSPRMALSGDFNRDGIDDLAIANGSGAALSVLLGAGANGKGNGTFSAPGFYASGASGAALATADFDRDGHMDLAVGVSTGVAVWRGTGAGAFTGGTLIAAGSNIRGVVCADLDRDGLDDIALASSSTNAVIVLRNTGDGAFAAPVSVAAGTAPARLVCADFDDDGDFDLACANNTSGSVSVFRNDGRGAFAAAANVAAPGSPWGLAVLDADRDGRADLLVSNGAGSTITLLRGDGAGGFASGGSFATSLAPRDLCVADFDGDGTVDVAAACAGVNQVSVLRGTGGGFVSLGNFAAGAGAAGACAGDFNSDSAPDVACANTSANTVSRFLGTCPPPAGAAVALLSPGGGESWWPGVEQTVRWTRSSGVAQVDVELSRDGGATWSAYARGLTGTQLTIRASGAASEQMKARVRDAAVSARAGASAGVFSLCGLFRAPLRTGLGFAATQVERADLDGDGYEDALAASATLAAVLRGDGNGGFAVGPPMLVDATRRMRLADVDGDGITDLVTLGANTLAWRAGDGAGGFGPARITSLPGAVDMFCADFDADGRADAAVLVNDGANAALVVRASAATPLDTEWRTTIDATPRQLVAADLDGDGITDLAIALGGRLDIWLGAGAAGRGNGRFALAATRDLPGGAGDLSLGDFDRDGRLDVAACALATSDVWMLETAPVQGGDGIVIGTPSATSAGELTRSPVVADFDGDGRADIALVMPSASQVRVLAGTSAGFGLPLSFTGGSGTMIGGDFAHDGGADLLVARPDSNDVLCLPSQCPPQGAAEIALASRLENARWPVGFARRIAWSRTSAVALARVELSRDGGAHWTAISSAVTDTAITFVVSGPATAHARVRVCDAGSSTRADVSAEFEIGDAFGEAASVTPAEPLRASTLALGTPRADGSSDAMITAGGHAYRVRAPGAAGASGSAQFEAMGESYVRHAQLLDLDGDGRDELLLMTPSTLIVKRGLPDGSFGDARVLGTAGANVAVLSGDFDEDGIADLAVACGAAPAQRVMLYRGLGPDVDGRMAFGAASQVAIPSPATAMTCADVDADGIADLLVAHGGGLSALLGNGSAGRGNGSFRVATTRAFGAGAVCALIAADFDLDGRLDVAGADSSLGALLVAGGNGAGGFATPVVVANAARANDVAWSDFDGDGTPDLALTSPAGVALLRGSRRVAADGFAPAGVPGASGSARAIAMRDMNGDGAPEVVALDGETGALVIRGGAAWTSPSAPALEYPAALHPATGAEITLHWSGLLAADVEYSADGGERWRVLARSVQGGAYRWSVSGLPTALGMVRVRDSFAPVRGATTAPFVIEPSTLGVALDLPRVALLGRATPNPSRDVVTVELALPRGGEARVDVCDVAGRHVRALHRGALAAGRHTVAWDGRSDAGAPLPPGTYFVRARVAGGELAQRVVRVR